MHPRRPSLERVSVVTHFEMAPAEIIEVDDTARVQVGSVCRITRDGKIIDLGLVEDVICSRTDWIVYLCDHGKLTYVTLDNRDDTAAFAQFWLKQAAVRRCSRANSGMTDEAFNRDMGNAIGMALDGHADHGHQELHTLEAAIVTESLRVVRRTYLFEWAWMFPLLVIVGLATFAVRASLDLACRGPWGSIFAGALIGGPLGAFISSAFLNGARANLNPFAPIKDVQFEARLRALVSIATGTAAGLAIQTGVFTSPLIKDEPSRLLMMVIAACIAGFSERVVPGLLGDVVDRLGTASREEGGLTRTLQLTGPSLRSGPRS